jgi:hypothetical protein
MHKPKAIRSKHVVKAGWLFFDTVLYAVFVFAYYFLVLHFMGDWLKRVFDENKALYAAVALTLIIAQGALLDLLTGWLFTKVRGKTK